ncbi:MAG: phosphopantetheine-binding protein [Anaerolineae bacterium]|nr:phosphopantetheine-binding protein [Anaerolineae bacterium]
MTENVVERKTDIPSKASEVTRLDECIQTVQEKVIELASISLGRGSETLGVDEPLYGTEAGFDSFSLLEFILHMEDEFGMAIPDEDLDPDIFRSINTVVAYVLRRIEEKETL